MKLITESDRIPENFTGIVEDSGNKFWYRNGKLHREDGPALEYANGTKFWYRNGKLHREDGPAVECANGIKFWYLNDKGYTESEYKAESKFWYLNNIFYTESEYKAEMTKRSTTPPCNGKIVEIDGKKYQLTAI